MNMLYNHLFLFEYIPQGSNVIIYGIGDVGSRYIAQIEKTKWCNIVGISDRKVIENMKQYHYLAPSELGNIESESYDSIIIAIENIHIASSVYEQMINWGIKGEKIYNLNMRTNQFPKGIEQKYSKYEDKLNIALVLCGGLGDCIIYESFYEKLLSLCPTMSIDIQCVLKLGQPIYATKKYINRFISLSDNISYDEYDIVLELKQVIFVKKIDENKVKQLAPLLYEKIDQYIKSWMPDKAILPNPYQFTDAIIIKRAYLLEANRYDMLGGKSIFNLKADDIRIDLIDSVRKEFEALNLGKYITLNWGAAQFMEGTTQIKVWPLEYFNQFVKLFKQKYPDYEVIQIGTEDTRKVEGVDRYILGVNLELIKYVLKYSMLHFDGEGGLVHLATALKTMCAVIFGPTPLKYYGYKRNINITVGECHNCMGAIEEWYIKCLKGEKQPSCIYGITPEVALERISIYLDTIKN